MSPIGSAGHGLGPPTQSHGQLTVPIIKDDLTPVSGLKFTDQLAASRSPQPGVVLDPTVQFGKPSIHHTRIPTSAAWVPADDEGQARAPDTPRVPPDPNPMRPPPQARSVQQSTVTNAQLSIGRLPPTPTRTPKHPPLRTHHPRRSRQNSHPSQTLRTPNLTYQAASPSNKSSAPQPRTPRPTPTIPTGSKSSATTKPGTVTPSVASPETTPYPSLHSPVAGSTLRAIHRAQHRSQPTESC